MSHRATIWAWNQQLAPIEKLVLLRLADCAPPECGQFEASMSRVAEDCGLADPAMDGLLDLALHLLQKRGLISWSPADPFSCFTLHL